MIVSPSQNLLEKCLSPKYFSHNERERMISEPTIEESTLLWCLFSSQIAKYKEFMMNCFLHI